MSLRTAALILLLLAGCAVHSLAANTDQRPPTRSPKLDTFAVDAGTRLLVIAPHPDDEVLGAGGLIQQVSEAHGIVHVVYLTSGEGYPEGVKAQERVIFPRPANFRSYGRRREREARRALDRLGVEPDSLSFLGFPNGGLHRLLTRYWSEHRAAFRSPYTRLDRPTKSETFLANTEYRGEDLTQELAMIIGDLRPTLIVVPRREDQHVDHCAAWFFLADALSAVERVDPGYQTELLTYVVHYFSWPFEDNNPVIRPPDGLASAAAQWRTVVLTDREMARKRAALQDYKSQMKMMDWFLMGFVRRNEVFAVAPLPRLALPLRRNRCGEFEETTAPAAFARVREALGKHP